MVNKIQMGECERLQVGAMGRGIHRGGEWADLFILS